MKRWKVYSRVAGIPEGNAPDSITDGCLVLEGGAWRGLYTQGALDVLMQHGINFQTTVGVSAGAMSAIGYLSGQIGWCPRINLTHRNDGDYTGIGAIRAEHGVTGFTYLFEELMQYPEPMNRERFFDPSRRFVAVAANVLTGEPVFFEKESGKRKIFRAVQASATVPYVSRPVVIDGQPYLDGGCAVKIPYDWACRQMGWKCDTEAGSAAGAAEFLGNASGAAEFLGNASGMTEIPGNASDAAEFRGNALGAAESLGNTSGMTETPGNASAAAEAGDKRRKPGKIMVIRTQDRTYRRKQKTIGRIDRLLYGNHPAFLQAMVKASDDYNPLLDRMDADMDAGKCFVLAPSRPVGISRFERDVEKIGALYELGRSDMEEQMPRLLAYLAADNGPENAEAAAVNRSETEAVNRSETEVANRSETGAANRSEAGALNNRSETEVVNRSEAQMAADRSDPDGEKR